MFFTSDMEVEEKTPVQDQRISESSTTNIYDITNDDCRCYMASNIVNEDDHVNDYEQFLDMPHVSATTMSSLSASTIPASGIFRAKLIRPVLRVNLPHSWLDLPIKCSTTGKNSFSGDYTNFFHDISRECNPFCCFLLKRNYIKKKNSRKKNNPYWSGTAVCKYGDVTSHMTIQKRDENLLKICFKGDVCHDLS